MTVVAEDALGNVETSFSGFVIVDSALSTGRVEGIFSVTAVNGVATFSGLTLDQAGCAYTLSAYANGGGLTPVTDSPVYVTPAVAVQWVVTAQPPGNVTAGPPFRIAIVTAGSPFGMTVAAEDALGNVDTSYNGAVTIALATNPDDATLGGTLSGTAVNGVATFTNLTLNPRVYGYAYTHSVSGGGLTPGTSAPVNVTTVVATQWVVTAQPPSSIVAGFPFDVSVAAEDAWGNLANSFNGAATISLANNPGGDTLGGTLVATAFNGVATFSGLTLNQAGDGYTVFVYDNRLTPVTSAPVNVTPGAATHCVMTAQPPSSIAAGSPFDVSVAAEDSSGDVATSFNGLVTIALATNPGGAWLGGMLTVNASNGVATFAGLTLDQAGYSYTLSVSGGDLTPVTSASVYVAPGAATQWAVTAQPPSSIAAGSPFGMTVAAEDALGNVATSYNGTVTIALATNPGGASLDGTLTVAAVKGVATFSGLTLNNPGTGYTLNVTASGVSSATTTGINVTAPAPQATQLLVYHQPTAPVPAGSPFSLVIYALTSTNALASSYSGNVTLTLVTYPPGAFLGGTTTVTASGGIASFPGLTLNLPGSYVIQATASTASGLSSVSTTITVPAPPPPPQIQGATVVTYQKTNKKGKPIGKPVLTGYQFTFNIAMNSSTTGLNNYQVQTYALVTVKKGKKKTKVLQLQNIGFSLKSISNNTVQVLLVGKQAFKYGGQLALVATPPTGISSAAGALLNGNAVSNIAKGGFGITLA